MFWTKIFTLVCVLTTVLSPSQSFARPIQELLDINSSQSLWGTPPCGSCAQEIQEETESKYLSQNEVFRLSLQQLEKMNPRFIAHPPKDLIREWCPHYNRFDKAHRQQLWAWIMTTMAEHESSFNPKEAYHEGQTDEKLSGIVSTGLLQISFDSSQAKPYQQKGCPIHRASELIYPSLNLGCGVAIIDSLIQRDSCLSCATKDGASAYWSVLRKPYTVENSNTGKIIHIGKKDELIKFVKSKVRACEN